jgi:hypothetical protein
MAIEIVDFPIKNGGSFHSYVELPEGSGFFEVFGCFWKVNDVFINHREMRELIHGCLKSNHFFF